MHFIKLGENFGGDPCHRVLEKKISTESDAREFVRHLMHEMNLANKEGRELVAELWTDFHEPNLMRPAATAGLSKGHG